MQDQRQDEDVQDTHPAEWNDQLLMAAIVGGSAVVSWILIVTLLRFFV